MGGGESTEVRPYVSKVQKKRKKNVKSNNNTSRSFTWKNKEGGLSEILKPSRIQLGKAESCTYECCVAANECITSGNNQPREWNILIKSLSYDDFYDGGQDSYLGFIDTDPDTETLGDHHKLGENSNRQYCATIPSSKLFIGDVFTFRVNLSTKKVKLLHNGAKPSKSTFPDLVSEWAFIGDNIYPAVGKKHGVLVYQIFTKNEDVTSLVAQLKEISLNHRLAVVNKEYDSEQKEGFGNKFSDNHSLGDMQIFHIRRKYKIEAPTSIAWVIKQADTKYRIDWGLRGSFCGLGVGRRRFTKTDLQTRESKIKVLFHFGFIFNGNDYKLTEPEFGAEHKDRHWMNLHLRGTDCIEVNLCASKTAACNALSEVWTHVGERESKDYKYYRLNPGFCRTSVQLIANVINREKKREYKLCYDKNTNWTSMKNLSKYTNCMLFVIRLCKICKMEIPDWDDEIIQMFDKWEDSERFENSWSHFKKYAVP